jgi:signal transduction histidine kinase
MTTRRATLLTSQSARSLYPTLGGIRGPSSALLWLRGMLARHVSIRGKLTLYYGFMCAATLGVAGLAMRTYIDDQFSRDINSSLQATAARVHQEIASAPTPKHAPSSGVCRGGDRPPIQAYCQRVVYGLRHAVQHLSASGQFEQVLLVLSLQGLQATIPQAVEEPGLSSKALPFPGVERMVQVGSGHQPETYDTTHNGQSVRVYLRPLDVPASLVRSGYAGVVEVVQYKQTFNQIQNRLDQTLLLVIPLGLLIALIAGWWIARAALRPINRISRTVSAIGGSRDLTRRLNFAGPDDEIGRLAATFDGMMDRLEQVFDTQKRFIADASHELRTPLTAIRGNADLMARAPSDEERQACLASIRSESQRMSRLVADLLLIAEADVAERQLHSRDVELDELVREVYRSAQVLAAGKVDIVLESVEPVTLLADPDRIKQLVLNLVDNAVKFTPGGGVVSLSVTRTATEARIDVSDSGVGIPREEQDAIFQRFYRTEESRTKRGHGLGLAICAWIARAHGGRIEVRSEPGKGSTFSVFLPLTPSADTPVAQSVITHKSDYSV